MKKLLLLLAVSATAMLALTSTASARDGDIRANGTCTASSSTKIKLGPRDGIIEVEFEVDQNRNGIVWNVTLVDNGIQVFSGKATTKAPSGSFEVRRRIANRSGPDTVTGTAVNPATGERCTVSATV